jgi:hypothetical protein
VIPVIIGAPRTISRSFVIYLSNIPLKHEIKELETAAILGTVHILWKVLMLKYKTLNMGNNITCTVNCKYRIAVNAMYPGCTVCLGYAILSTLHKGNKRW